MEKIKLYVNISHAYVAESVDMFFIVFTRSQIIAAGKLFLKWNHYWSVGGPFSTLKQPNLSYGATSNLHLLSRTFFFFFLAR